MNLFTGGMCSVFVYNNNNNNRIICTYVILQYTMCITHARNASETL